MQKSDPTKDEGRQGELLAGAEGGPVDATVFETAIHGRRWTVFHGGFFSDAEVARPLVDEISTRLARNRPDIVADLGGGTGFLLAQVKLRHPDVALVDLDTCPIQLGEAARAGIPTVQRSLTEFRRCDVAPDGQKVMYIMRSVFHYLGEAGLEPALRHVRAQARPGELFIHQTASFESDREAACMNAIYRMMKTNKWYPTVERMRRSAEGTGWRVRSVTPVPSLRLTAHDLSTRYHVDKETIRRMRDEIGAEFADARDVFHRTRDAFVAHLKYEVYECEAVEP